MYTLEKSDTAPIKNYYDSPSSYWKMIIVPYKSSTVLTNNVTIYLLGTGERFYVSQKFNAVQTSNLTTLIMYTRTLIIVLYYFLHMERRIISYYFPTV